MQIIKKRLSVHRTGKILRNLWAEYLQNDANGSGDAARLQTLSSFMENILDADAQLPTIMDELFEDISVIITGLLDVAQRSALQLREQWNSLDTSERSTLGDALRKALLVGELCLREEKNREQIVSAHGIVSRILTVLKSVEYHEDRRLTLSIVGHVVRHADCRIEFCRAGGFRALSDLLTVEASSGDIISASHQTCSRYTDLLVEVLAVQHGCLNGSSAAIETQQRNNMHGNQQQADFSIKGSSSSSSVPNVIRPHSTQQSSANDESPLSMATRGISMAFSVVHEIISSAPLSATWLQRLNGGDRVPPATDGGNEDAVLCETPKFDIAILQSDIEAENQRLETLVSAPENGIEDRMPVSEASVSMDTGGPQVHFDREESVINHMVDQVASDNILCQCDFVMLEPQDVTSLLILSLADIHSVPRYRDDMACCLLCTTRRYLCTHQSAQKDFGARGGYDALFIRINALVEARGKMKSCNGCSECVEHEITSGMFSHSEPMERSHWSPDCDSSVVVFILSLVFDTIITRSMMKYCMDSSYDDARRNGYFVRNMEALKFVVRFLGSSGPLRQLGIVIIDAILRINPLCVVALRSCGGVRMLSTLLVENSILKYVTVKKLTGNCGTDQNLDSVSCEGDSKASHSSPRPLSFLQKSEQGHDCQSGVSVNITSTSTGHSGESSGSVRQEFNQPSDNRVSNSVISSADTIFSHEVEPGDVADEVDRALMLIRLVSSLLLRIAVIDSTSGVQQLSLFVFLVYRFSAAVRNTLPPLSPRIEPGKSHNETKRTPLSSLTGQHSENVVGSLSSRCSYCEAEDAVFECSNHSCICEGLHKLCRECDRVFHKAVTKRSHVRFPILSAGYTDESLREQLDDEVRSIFETKSSDVTNMDIIAPFATAHLEAIASVIALFLCQIRRIVDDRRARHLDIPEVTLHPLLLTLRHLIFAAINDDETGSNSVFGNVDLFDGFVGEQCAAEAVDNYGGDCEPPEDTHYKSRRVCFSLCVQVLSRYFCDAKCDTALAHLPATSRVDLINRIRTFREVGGDSCLVLMITDRSRFFALTSSDKQYAVWTLREIIASAYRADITHATSLLKWLVWLLGCPAHDDIQLSSSHNVMHPWNNFACNGVQKDSLSQDDNRRIVCALPPAGHQLVSSAVKIFVVQELRILMGGDSWLPLLSDPHAASVQSKLTSILQHTTCSADITRTNGSKGALYFHIPTSNRWIQSHMVKYGAVELFVDCLFGERCDSRIRTALFRSDSSKSDCCTFDDSDNCLSDIHIEEWWSTLAAFVSLITNNRLAKEKFDDCFGVTRFARTILPFIVHASSDRQNIYLANTLIELCIGGGQWLAPSPAFSTWMRLSALKTNEVSCTRKQYEHLLENSKDDRNLVCMCLRFATREISKSIFKNKGNSCSSASDLAPIFFARNLAVKQISDCVCPSFAFWSVSCSPSIPSNTRQVSSSSTGGVLRGSVDNKSRQDLSTLFTTDSIDWDDASTGRGSFSLHGVPRGYSFSTMPTPPPSVVGDSTYSPRADDISTALSSRSHFIRSGGLQDGKVYEGCESGEYNPLLDGLGWSLSHLDDLILRVLYDSLLVRADVPQAQNASTNDSAEQKVSGSESGDINRGSLVDTVIFRQSDPLLTSLKVQSVEQHLQVFLRSHDTNNNGDWTTVVGWEPKYSQLRFRNSECAELIFGTLLACSGESQNILLNAVSHFIDGNPSNGEIISRRGTDLAVTRIMLTSAESSRTRLCHVLSQLLRQTVSACALDMLVSIARTIHDTDMMGVMNVVPLLPLKGTRQYVINAESDLDDAGCQILYMLGMAVELPGPKLFTHFDQGCPLSSQVVLPPITRTPSPQSGMSIVTWIRIGNLGSCPISTILQITDCDTFNIKSRPGSRRQQGGSRELNSVNIFFRVMYKTTVSSREYDSVSVASGGCSDSQAQPEEKLDRRVLQLCISYNEQKSTCPDYQCSTSEPSNIPAEAVLGLDGRIVSSLAHFCTPDVIVEYDWSEMGSWHLLCVSLSSVGVQCSVDGVSKRVLYWTALGYVELTSSGLQAVDRRDVQLPVGIKYPTASRDLPLHTCIGGLLDEQVAYDISLDSLSSWARKSRFANYPPDFEAKISRELDFLQTFKTLVGGFSGFLGGFAVFEGMPDSAMLASAYHSGVGSGLAEFSSLRKLVRYSPEESMYSGTSATVVHSDRIGKDVGRQSQGESDIGVCSEESRGRVSSRRSSGIDHLDASDKGGSKPGVPSVSSRRISRSLSPATVSRAMDNIAQPRDEMGLSSFSMYENHDSTTGSYNDPSAVASGQQNSSSLVTELLTMFSGPSKDEDKDNVPSTMIHGSVRVHSASLVVSEMSRLGGLVVWYPLLVIDRPRQVATLRIIASLITSSGNVYDEYNRRDVDSVILYCLQATPQITSEASMQVLFDLTATVPGVVNLQSFSLQSHRAPDKIQRINFLSLAVNISVASPKRMQLARSTVEWLIELCDDSPENVMKLLDAIGMTPFFIILSLWITCDEVQSVQALTDSFCGGRVEYGVKLPTTSTNPEASSHSMRHRKATDNAASGDPGLLKSASLPYKLQLAVSRLLKLIITGTSGQLPSLPIPVAMTTPSGFSVNYMQDLFRFIELILRFEGHMLPSHLPRSATQSPAHDKCLSARGEGISTDEAHSVPLYVSGKKATSPEAWKLHAVQLALDCILNACDGPLVGTILQMSRSALPGNALWYFIFDLLGCSHVAIKARGLHLLGLSLSSNTGELDQRLVSQFDRIQGFACIASRMCDFSGDSEPVVDALLSLLFWRMGKRGNIIAEKPQSKGSTTSAMFHKLDVIDEVESVTGTSDAHRSRVNTTVSLNEDLHATSSESVLETHSFGVNEVYRAAHESALPPHDKLQASIECESHRSSDGGKFDGEETGLQQKASQIAAPQNSGLMSMFNWMGRSSYTNATSASSGGVDVPRDAELSSPLDEKSTSQSSKDTMVLESGDDGPKEISDSKKLSAYETHPIVGEQEFAVTGTVTDSRQSYSFNRCNGAENSGPSRKCCSKAEMIALPQLLQPLLAVLQNENSPDRVSLAIIPLEECINPSSFGTDESDAEAMARATRNVEILCGQKDWLLWICECLLFFRRRSSQDLLSDSAFLSASEGESASGLDSGDESLEGGHYTTYQQAYGVRSLSGHNNILDRYTDPLLNLVQAALALDVVMKPHSSRKMYDIMRLPVPEARDYQLAMLFDILESYEKQSQSANAERSLNLMRNLSSLLDQVLEKCETTLDFCVRAVHVMNSLTFHAPPEARTKIKDSLLPDVRNAYVTRCLVDRSENVWSRVSSLAELHSSVLNLLVSGAPTRTIHDQHVLLLFLEMFLEACDQYIDSAGDAYVGDVVNLQIAALVLVQNSTQSSGECHRTIEKILSSQFSDDQREILLDGFTNSFGSRNPCSSPIDDLAYSPPTSTQRSWWGSWGSGPPTESTSPTTNLSPKTSPGTSRHISKKLQSESSISRDFSKADDVDNSQTRDIRFDAQESQNFESDDEVEAGTGRDGSCGSESTLECEGIRDIAIPMDSSAFIEWFNSSAQRECVEQLKIKVSKMLPAVYQRTDKIQEKLAQRRSRNVRQLQDKLQKDKAILGKAVCETLAKARSSNDKLGRTQEQTISKWVHGLHQRILKGSREFRSSLKGNSVDIDAESYMESCMEHSRKLSEETVNGKNSSCSSYMPDDGSADRFVTRLDWMLDHLHTFENGM